MTHPGPGPTGPGPGGPGPKPGPTGPTPRHGNAHTTPGPSDAALRPPGDPGSNPDPRGPFRDDDPAAAGVGPPPVEVWELSDEEYAAALERRDARLEYERNRLPRFGGVIRDAERLAAQLINLLGRDYDPASALDVEAYPGELLADVRLAMLRADVQQVLRGLGDLADLRHPPAGSAVPVYLPDRPAPPRPPGERPLPPGLAAADPGPAAACESQDGPPSIKAGANVDLFVNEASNRRPQ